MIKAFSHCAFVFIYVQTKEIPFMGLIDTWEYDPFVSLDSFSQTNCLPIKWNCSAWLNFSDSLSIYEEELFYLSKFLGQSLFTYRNNCLFYSDKLSPCRGIKAFLITLSRVTAQHEKNDWQLLLCLVFPFMRGTSFYSLSLYGKLDYRINYTIIAIITFALLQSS